ncbi:RNA polymerase subunit sigma [Streptomyces sp. NPDC008238]
MDHARETVPIGELIDERRHLLDVAYWMLGSGSQAESVVDETYRRWYGLSDAARIDIRAPRSWLTKVAWEICLARPADPDGRRANGPALPGTGTDAADRAGHAPAALVALALQRSRAGTPAEHDTIAHAVRQACAADDAARLASLLAPDATAFFDGGGKVRALVRPAYGAEYVARSLLTLLAPRPRTVLTTQAVNGRSGLVARYDHQVAAVISLGIADDHVTHIWSVLNPDKLRAWNRPGGSIRQRHRRVRVD